MNRFKTDKQCMKRSANDWMCDLPEKHLGNTHVAIGEGNRVIEVWTIETVTETREKVEFLKEIA